MAADSDDTNPDEEDDKECGSDDHDHEPADPSHPFRSTFSGIDTSAFRTSMFSGIDTSAFRTSMFSGGSWPRLAISFFAELERQVEEDRRESLRRASLPSNLRGIPGLTAEDVLDFTEKHAVSLYLVAPTNVAQSFLNADDVKAVRRILGDRKGVILETCAETLAECDSPGSVIVRTAAQQAIAALEQDLYYPAQALAATVVDRLLSGQDLPPELCAAARRKKEEPPADMRARLTNLDNWQAYIAAALWAAFQQYHKKNGDKVPASFSRHGTVHALGPRQYSRRSAVQGVMVATSAIAHMNGLN